MTNFIQDLLYALRALRKNPAFTAVAVLTLALGIGANTAIFSVIDAVLLRALPFPQPDRLVNIWGVDDRSGDNRRALCYPDFEDVRAQSHSFEALAVMDDTSLTLSGTGEPVHLNAGVVSADFFRILRANPQLGRLFEPEEDKPGTRVVLLSDRMWRERLGSDPSIVGRALTLNERSYTVVGVLRPGFQFPPSTEPYDLWTTIAVDRVASPGEKASTEQRGAHFLNAIGRIRPEAQVSQANAEVSGIATALARQYPDTNLHHGLRAEPALDALVGDVRPALWVVFAAVGLVLLIACANVANLLLARSTARQREIAVRAALGASRARLLRQLLTESFLLALAGAVPGVLLAIWATGFAAKASSLDIPRIANATVDWHTLLFTLAATLLTAGVFGIAPALHASRFSLTGSLREGSRGGGDSAGHARLRSLLVVLEVTLALMLLVGSGLLIESLVRILSVPPGFDPQGVIAFDLDLPGTRYGKPEQSAQFFRELTPHLAALPSVVSASGVMPLPLSDNSIRTGFEIEGRPVPKGEEPPTQFRCVGLNYFGTMRIPLVAGRVFTSTDSRDSSPVVIINQSFARQFFAGENPIGKRIKPGISDHGDSVMREIVGVVGDVRHRTLWREPGAEAYVPYEQVAIGGMTMVVRTAGDPQQLVSLLRREVQRIDPQLPLYGVKTLDQYISGSVAQRRFLTALLGTFGGLALLLAVIGLYGVMSYAVSRRTHEIGVRVALGASSADVLSLIVGQGLRMTLLGIALGWLCALATTRFLSSLLFGVSAGDPITFLAVSAVFLAVALAACLVPARRAMRVDPLVALRYE